MTENGVVCTYVLSISLLWFLWLCFTLYNAASWLQEL